jgi:signal transduction histidine kinase
MLLAPLIAHDVMLGVLAVTRDTGAVPFSGREAHRLRAIADYAALALWKADLLDQAQAADRAKSRFLATVSHELRTPLTALAGYEELLADQVVGPLADGQLDILERMRSVTQHLASVIEEVLTFSSLDEGRETIRPTDFLAADLVRATAAVIEPLARQKHLAFDYSISDAPIRMTSDVDKIRQILINLAGNAVKFTDKGEVRLDVERHNGDVRFTVRDTGIGIARDDLDRLFKPFAQLDTRLTRRHGGTGLGLYIARRLAELLGGRIDVESQPGKGSAFSLVLPRDDA